MTHRLAIASECDIIPRKLVAAMSISSRRFFTMTSLGALALAASLTIQPAFAAGKSSPVGVWKTVDDETGKVESLVKIYERNGKLYGTLTKLLLEPGAKCKACSGARKNKPIEGMQIIWDLKLEKGKWSGGKIFDPRKGKAYRCKLWLDGNNSLKVRGYLGFLYRTQTWRRVE